ncbi:MAG: peptidase M2 family protein [Acidobacteria bacterium]|nr:peptidase M2 family protein [Acidobacteriota bacterium]
MSRAIFAALACFALLAACGGGGEAQPTPESAKAFVESASAELEELYMDAERASWLQATYIVYDSQVLSSKLLEKAYSRHTALAKEAVKFDGLELPEDVARQLKILKLSVPMPTPADPALSKELADIVTGMEAAYGKGEYCPDSGKNKGKCLADTDMIRILAESRDPDEMLDVWQGWRRVSPPFRNDYNRFVELSNQGARELGFKDTGALWRSGYDMPPDEFAAELDRLWEQVKPLYVSLHAYVRTQLRKKYGDSVVPADGPIPAHLLGNMWSQSWENVYPLVAPANADPGYDLTKILEKRKVDARGMVRYGEAFFTSLGFKPLPDTFWERSLFTRPRDRDVVCHASAWDIDGLDDLRLKMCIEANAEDFTTIHHELGHNFYQRAYKEQPWLFKGSANDGFHEAVGDTIALSITPEYLVRLGFLDKPTDPSKDVGLLMQRALEKVAFLPFGLLIDQWRWKVFSGEISPEQLNAAWWELREKYQGIAAPIARSEADFDPGAKYHVPANVPYTRYFLAHILQFQFHRGLAQAAGCDKPLHRCSIYESEAAGQKLNAMLEMGQSRPWPEALEAIDGRREMDATAILDYFAPLQSWLDEQNQGQPTGW